MIHGWMPLSEEPWRELQVVVVFVPKRRRHLLLLLVVVVVVVVVVVTVVVFLCFQLPQQRLQVNSSSLATATGAAELIANRHRQIRHRSGGGVTVVVAAAAPRADQEAVESSQLDVVQVKVDTDGRHRQRLGPDWADDDRAGLRRSPASCSSAGGVGIAAGGGRRRHAGGGGGPLHGDPLAEGAVPVVLDFIVCSPRQPPGYQRPSASIVPYKSYQVFKIEAISTKFEKEKNNTKVLVRYVLQIYSSKQVLSIDGHMARGPWPGPRHAILAQPKHGMTRLGSCPY
ncbi:hypothetical protein OsJ_10694 [Oryza sativa Japonica Group]|uniref:Uncharacterized protein n=1 Tax=Oryza sativa subsp. japonica TaxID=39947 RepID=B9F889_ORYSJ|nr:hypothetical protein OsJ_10694 [Oryza sativa Japonica Group]